MTTTPPSVPPPASWDDAERMSGIRSAHGEENPRTGNECDTCFLLDKLDAARAEIATLKDENERVRDDYKDAADFSSLVSKRNDALRAELARLRSAAPSDDLRAEFLACAQYDATMEGPKFKGYNRSSLNRLRKKYEALASPQPDAGARGKGGSQPEDGPQSYSINNAGLVEQVDTEGLNPSALVRDGSSPSSGTIAPPPSPEAAPLPKYPERSYMADFKFSDEAAPPSADDEVTIDALLEEQRERMPAGYEGMIFEIYAKWWAERIRALAPDPKEKRDEH